MKLIAREPTPAMHTAAYKAPGSLKAILEGYWDAAPTEATEAVVRVLRAFHDLCVDVRERYKMQPDEKFRCPIMQRGSEALDSLPEGVRKMMEDKP